MNAVLKPAGQTIPPQAKVTQITKAAKVAGGVQDQLQLTDVGNSMRFAAKFAGELLFVPARGAWFEFTEHAWRQDTLGRVTQRAIEVTKDMMLDASKKAIEAAQCRDQSRQAALAAQAETLLQHARKSQQKQRLDAMLTIASTHPKLAVEQARLDADDLLLGVKNGVIELGAATKFRPGRPEDLITRQAGTVWLGGDEDVACPQWERFLEQVQPDPDVRHWLQKFVGYCLTGKTSEQMFLVMHGTGANGKSVLIEVLKRLLGAYLQTVQFATFVERDPNAIRNDLAALDKARLVVASEGPDGARLDEGVVKQVTGEDAVTARFLHREFFTYTPRFKVVLVTNHKPVITGTDHGIWRRVILVPFPVTIPKEQQDKQLLDKLTAELPGILAWAIKGFHLWQEQGLGDLPKALAMANADYRKDSDVLGFWLEDNCVLEITPQSTLFSSSRDLYQNYSIWASDMGHRPMSNTSLGNKLRERGLMQDKFRGERGWRGIRLKAPAD